MINSSKDINKLLRVFDKNLNNGLLKELYDKQEEKTNALINFHFVNPTLTMILSGYNRNTIKNAKGINRMPECIENITLKDFKEYELILEPKYYTFIEEHHDPTLFIYLIEPAPEFKEFVESVGIGGILFIYDYKITKKSNKIALNDDELLKLFDTSTNKCNSFKKEKLKQKRQVKAKKAGKKGGQILNKITIETPTDISDNSDKSDEEDYSNNSDKSDEEYNSNNSNNSDKSDEEDYIHNSDKSDEEYNSNNSNNSDKSVENNSNTLHISFNNKKVFNKCDIDYIVELLNDLYNENLKFKDLFNRYNKIWVIKNIHLDRDYLPDTNHFNIKLINNDEASNTFHCYIRNNKISRITEICSII
jgi:hypothetical protein